MPILTITYPKLDSTNEEAKRVLLANGSETPFVIVTNEQFAGRGTADRKWEAKPGENITATFCFTVNELAPQPYPVSIRAAFVATEFLSRFGIVAKIKYPNDVYVEDCKIGGILTEVGFWGQKNKQILVGIGINVNQNVFMDAVVNATSMSLVTNLNYKIETLMERLNQVFYSHFIKNEMNINRLINDRLQWSGKVIDCLDTFGKSIETGILLGISSKETIELQKGKRIVNVNMAKVKSIRHVD